MLKTYRNIILVIKVFIVLMFECKQQNKMCMFDIYIYIFFIKMKSKKELQAENKLKE